MTQERIDYLNLQFKKDNITISEWKEWTEWLMNCREKIEKVSEEIARQLRILDDEEI